MIRLMVGNQRGGVGKTTTAVNLARCFADKGLRTLLVDADPQGSIATVLKLRPENVLSGFLFGKLRLADCVVSPCTNLDILCGDRTTMEAEQRATGQFGRERVFEEAFAPADDKYDAVLIDVSPSISLMQACSQVYTRQVLIPVSMDTLSVSGAASSLLNSQMLSTAVKVDIKTVGMVPTIVDKRIGLMDVVMGMIEVLAKQNHTQVFPLIRTDTSVGKSMRAKQFLAEFDPKSRALEDYQKVAEMLIELLGTKSNEPAIETVA
jgi:chromosome partitioning protein